jgi:hypothetical protein
MYDTLLNLLQARPEPLIMRIEKMEPQIEWGNLEKPVGSTNTNGNKGNIVQSPT